MFLKSKKKNLSDQKPPPEAAVRLDRTLRIWTMTWKQSLHCSGHDLVFGRPPWPRHGRHICLYFTSKHKDPSAFPLFNEANVLFTWTEAIISLFWFLCVLSSKVKAVYLFCCSLTWMCDSWFDLDGRATPAVLLHLRHPLTGHLIGVFCGTDRDLVLDDALTVQLLSSITAQGHGHYCTLQYSLLY